AAFDEQHVVSEHEGRAELALADRDREEYIITGDSELELVFFTLHRALHSHRCEVTCRHGPGGMRRRRAHRRRTTASLRTTCWPAFAGGVRAWCIPGGISTEGANGYDRRRKLAEH